MGNNEGDDWVERASDTIHFPDDTYHVGLAITSHDNNYLSEAVFEDYTVEQLTIPTPSPTGTAAASGAPATPSSSTMLCGRTPPTVPLMSSPTLTGSTPATSMPRPAS